jgi:transposase InsO family protein
MCSRALAVSRSGYYAWRRRPESNRSRENRCLLVEIKAVYEEHRQAHGSPRITETLRAHGIRCSENRDTCLMRQHGMQAKRQKLFKVTTHSKHNLAVAPNLLVRDFEVEAPNRVWTADITYIPTDEGWLYLAVVMDLFFRRTVGWALQRRMTERLAVDALLMALLRRRPGPGLVVHSDRGRQNASGSFRKLHAAWHLRQSMGRRGDCWDNAPVKSFFATLKLELVSHRRYSSRRGARSDIFEWIAVFYSRKRMHSKLGYQSPAYPIASLL